MFGESLKKKKLKQIIIINRISFNLFKFIIYLFNYNILHQLENVSIKKKLSSAKERDFI